MAVVENPAAVAAARTLAVAASSPRNLASASCDQRPVARITCALPFLSCRTPRPVGGAPAPRLAAITTLPTNKNAAGAMVAQGGSVPGLYQISVTMSRCRTYLVLRM
jgi:hypothetical protein